MGGYTTMPPLLFDYMRKRDNVHKYQAAFDKAQSEEAKITKENANIRSIRDDFARVVLLNPELYINGKPITSEMRTRYHNEFNSRPEKSTHEEDRRFVQNMFQRMLYEHDGTDVTKLDPTALQSFMDGFHQAGYAYALENTLKESLPTDPNDPSRFKPAMAKRLDISYDKSNPQEISLTETIKVILIADLQNPKEKQATEEYVNASRAKQAEFNPIATATATYKFSNNKIPDLTPPEIKPHPENDKHNMLRQLPDDRTLMEKLKSLFENMFGDSKKERTTRAKL